MKEKEGHSVTPCDLCGVREVVSREKADANGWPVANAITPSTL